MTLIQAYKQRLILLCFIYNFAWKFIGVGAVRPLVLSCDRDEDSLAEMDPAKGEQGVPGKRGPVGSLGPRGLKGNKGNQGSIPPALIDRITNLESQNMMNLQNITLLLQHQQEILKKLETAYRRDCNDIAGQGYTQSGLYNVLINRKVVTVYCDMQTDGGKWLTIQRRLNGDLDFYRNWNDYEEGFGNQTGNFWLGLETIHGIISAGDYELRVDIEDWEGNSAYAKYSTFGVGSSSENYVLRVGGYSGNAGNSLVYHNGQAFTTKDRDNDGWSSGNCANSQFGAWWYKVCHESNLNGRYRNAGPGGSHGLSWKHWKNSHYSMKTSWMRIRRK